MAYSVDMLGGLPGAMVAATEPYARTACLEAFLIHARLLIEFLLVHPADPNRDFSARDFGWSGAPQPDRDHLDEMWTTASQHLVHFSKKRAPASMYALRAMDTSAAGLGDVAHDILAVFETFVVDLESHDGAEAETFRQCLDNARSNLATAHLPSE